MSAALYYSNYCDHCKELLMKVSRTKISDDIHFICIDKRVRQNDGSTHIILENGQHLLLPPNVTKVPSVLLLHHGNRVIDGLKEIYNYLNPAEVEMNNNATQQNGEPLAFSTCEMGSTLSDNYSYLDMSSDELSAKGNGGLRMMHNYTTISDNQTIATPPDDYEPNKVGDVDMSKLEAERNQDIQISQ
jgi:hypothetical protein